MKKSTVHIAVFWAVNIFFFGIINQAKFFVKFGVVFQLLKFLAMLNSYKTCFIAGHKWSFLCSS